MKKIMIIAGEVSGDMHGAKLVASLKEKMPDSTFFGLGGELMRAEGVETFYDVKELAAIGFTEVVSRIWFFKKVFFEMLDKAIEERPDVVVFIDYPGFNLRLAERLHAIGIKTVHYICPQVWAWNQKRIPKIAKIIDLLITIFPFEKDIFKGQSGLQVEFAGHPLVDKAHVAKMLPALSLPWQGAKQKISILPGSRRKEIALILKPMLKACVLLEKQFPDAHFIVAAATTTAEKQIVEIMSKIKLPKNISVVADNTREVLRQADASFTTSGTATLETSLMECPMVVVYKTSWLTYMMGRMLIKIDHIGMVNIVADKTVCPELIQYNATPKKLADTLRPLLTNTEQRKKMKSDILDVNQKLGHGNADENAAKFIFEFLNKVKEEE
jgi:lipid-A-disaccharide synthase